MQSVLTIGILCKWQLNANIKRVVFLTAIIASVLASLSGCSAVPHHKPESPQVAVESVRLIGLSLKSQTLGLTLRVSNPNNYDLPIKQLNFNALIAGDLIAQGESTEQVTIPANGEAFMEVSVKAGLGKLITPILSAGIDQSSDLNYQVTGTLKLSNWPATIPFNVSGELEDKL